MTWLLDTNIVSELGKPEPDAHLVAWLEAHAEDCALSVTQLCQSVRISSINTPSGTDFGTPSVYKAAILSCASGLSLRTPCSLKMRLTPGFPTRTIWLRSM